MTAPPDSSPALPLQCAAELEGYRTRSNQALTPEALEHTVQLLNDAGVGRYDVGGRFGEPVPNVEGAVGRAGLALRKAVADLTWERTNANLEAFERRLRQWREAVAREQGVPVAGVPAASVGAGRGIMQWVQNLVQ